MTAEVMAPSVAPDPVAPDSAAAGKVVVVHSAKGGVGTTTVAVNIAAAMHARGRRVCLVDLDLGCGDVAVALRLEPRNTILDVLADDTDEEVEEPIDILRTIVEPGFNCILAPAQSTDPAELPGDVLADLIPYLRSIYDAVVIDTPTSMSVHTRTAFELADVLVLVSTPDVSSLRGLTIGLDRSIALNAPRPVVVLNQVERGEGMPAEEIAAGLGVEIAVRIARDPMVARSGNRGEAMVKAEPNSPFTSDIDRLVDRWVARKKGTAKVRPLHRRKGFKL
ncbi:hypothetical protein Back2_14930 [Nocardioides baekrokdamisoli]|uniref:AAA domain-containing protein n=1 Tax=Nocardioides baekrokdamisoli TaxID=1804624 RepID=A0A3G9IFV5_9ACTN|nr:AAA family ATPase [Nocardioides baekrokdamisoli]BBH17206.1 hypothetical protein Back2_14930 [Nocardioides baekrokdamisoli]